MEIKKGDILKVTEVTEGYQGNTTENIYTIEILKIRNYKSGQKVDFRRNDIRIGGTLVLKEMDIKPDKMIGQGIFVTRIYEKA